MNSIPASTNRFYSSDILRWRVVTASGGTAAPTLTRSCSPSSRWWRSRTWPSSLSEHGGQSSALRRKACCVAGGSGVGEFALQLAGALVLAVHEGSRRQGKLCVKIKSRLQFWKSPIFVRYLKVWKPRERRANHGSPNQTLLAWHICLTFFLIRQIVFAFWRGTIYVSLQLRDVR